MLRGIRTLRRRRARQNTQQTNKPGVLGWGPPDCFFEFLGVAEVAREQACVLLLYPKPETRIVGALDGKNEAQIMSNITPLILFLQYYNVPLHPIRLIPATFLWPLFWAQKSKIELEWGAKSTLPHPDPN